jgi:hypothetical protein
VPTGWCGPPRRCLGCDECALRRGCTDATLLVDWERRRPVAVRAGRTAEPVVSWLHAHLQVTILVRDRAWGLCAGSSLACTPRGQCTSPAACPARTPHPATGWSLDRDSTGPPARCPRGNSSVGSWVPAQNPASDPPLAEWHVGAFEPWLQPAEPSALPSCQTVARSCRQDDAALLAALTPPWRTGQDEGPSCRMTLLTRLG